MAEAMEYLFDTNIFITSKNQLPVDVWPTFWHRMTELIRGGRIFTSTKVKEEIERGKDELTDWMKHHAMKGFYIPLDVDILAQYAATQNWARGNAIFNLSALQTYADVADAYLVATAAAKNMVLVTYEKSNPTSKRRVMIPDACQALGVRCCDLNSALRELGVTI
jgi:predicted nucleic acid-binding protein